LTESSSSQRSRLVRFLSENSCCSDINFRCSIRRLDGTQCPDVSAQARTTVGCVLACASGVGDVRVAIVATLILALGAAGGWLLYSRNRVAR